MNRVILPVLLFAYFLHINSVSSADNSKILKLLNNNWNNGTNNCTSGGLKCLDCYTSQFCIWNAGNNTYDEYLEYCYGGETCSNGTCTIYHDPHCSHNTTKPSDFECRTHGMYPDPYDCKKYHYCVPTYYDTYNSTSNSTLRHYSAECDCNFGYNPLTKSCNLKLTNNTCSPYDIPVPPCFERGQSHALWRNPSIYYICLQNYNRGDLYPYMYGCDHGKRYNSEKYICE